LKRILSVLCITALLLTTLPLKAVANSTPAFQDSTNTSTWLWDTSEIVTNPDSIIQQLVDNNVKFLFLQVNDTIDINYYRSFISKATINMISVYALDGEANWVSDEGSPLQQDYINWLIEYQQSALTNEKFKGIHLDVEPYENENDWYDNRIIENYQNFIVKFRNHAIDLDLEFGIDIPFWFYKVKYNTKYGHGNLAKWLCKNVKSMTIMAYRDTASGSDGIIGICAAEMRLFNKYNVKGNIAVETGALEDGNEFVTFYEENQAYMYQQLDLVYEIYKDNPAFNGIAIHYFDSWMSMAK